MTTEDLDAGREIQVKLWPQMAAGATPRPAAQLAPDFYAWVTETAFGKIWSREALPLRDRSLVTVAMLAALGRTDEAVAEYREALRLRPAYAEIHFNLAMALLNAPGRRGEAAEQLEEFLLARPGNEAAWRILGQIRADRPAPP